MNSAESEPGGAPFWETVDRCPVCQRFDREVIEAGLSDLQVDSPRHKYDLFRCNACRIAYLSPRPTRESLHLFYPDDYLPVEVTSRGDRGKGMNRVLRLAKWMLSASYRMRFGSPDTTFAPFGQGRLLEVGCGNGEYLLAMKQLGWDVTGCDLMPEKVERLRLSLGAKKVFACTIRDLSFPSGHFDAIALWHVIEHLHDPLGDLRAISRLLKPGGSLVIGTPNLQCAESAIFRGYWKGYDVPRHLVVFSLEGLSAVLEQCGFQVQRARPSVFASTVADSLALFSNGYLNFPLWGSRLHRLFYYAVYPFVVASYCLGNWPVVEVTAVKVGGRA